MRVDIHHVAIIVDDDIATGVAIIIAQAQLVR
jgi:hypothetical protein